MRLSLIYYRIMFTITNKSRSIKLSQLRVETARYAKTGKVYAELYYPDDEVTPIATTEPIFTNREVAIKLAIETFEHWMTQSREEFTK